MVGDRDWKGRRHKVEFRDSMSRSIRNLQSKIDKVRESTIATTASSIISFSAYFRLLRLRPPLYSLFPHRSTRMRATDRHMYPLSLISFHFLFLSPQPLNSLVKTFWRYLVNGSFPRRCTLKLPQLNSYMGSRVERVLGTLFDVCEPVPVIVSVR